LTINHLYCCISLVFFPHALLTMHGHRNIKFWSFRDECLRGISLIIDEFKTDISVTCGTQRHQKSVCNHNLHWWLHENNLMNAESVWRTTDVPVTFNLDFKYQITFKNLYFCRWFLCFLVLCTECPWLLPEEKQLDFLLANVAHLFLKCIVTVYATQNKQRAVYTLFRIIYLDRISVYKPFSVLYLFHELWSLLALLSY